MLVATRGGKKRRKDSDTGFDCLTSLKNQNRNQHISLAEQKLPYINS